MGLSVNPAYGDRVNDGTSVMTPSYSNLELMTDTTPISCACCEGHKIDKDRYVYKVHLDKGA